MIIDNFNNINNPKKKMKRILLIVVLLVFTVELFSQVNKGSEITSEGYSKTRVKPDLASLNITIVKENLVEKTAIKELNEEIEKLQKALLKIGFTEKNIKISDFKISTDNNSNNSNNKKEYSVINSLSINFSLDNKLIEAFYQEIQNEDIKDLSVDFETYLSEELEKSSRQKLVQIAIADAKNNAENIAKALSVKIVNVKQVSKYSIRDMSSYDMKVDQIKFERPVVPASSPRTSFDKFEVVEKELEETISIVYEITKN